MNEHSEAASHDAPSAEADSPRKRWIVRRMYDWTISWADTPHAAWALFVLAVAEASFFPIPPDVLLVAMALGAPRKALRYSGICMLGSIIGGCIGYGIGMFFFEAVGEPLIELYHAQETFNTISQGFRQHGFLWIFGAALTPIPYKVFTIAAGVCRVNFGVLVAASVVGRGLRFFALGILLKLFGKQAQKLIDKYFNWLTLAFFVLLVLGFVCAKILW